MAPYLSQKQRVGLALCFLLLSENGKKRKKRNEERRRQLTRVTLAKELEADEFRCYMRMNEDCFTELLAMVGPLIRKKDTLLRYSVSAEDRLIVTLRYLATGKSYRNLKVTEAISPALLSSIIPETCAAICGCLKEYMKLPSSEDEWKAIAKEYEEKWNFSHCLGVAAGKHIAIQKPADSGSRYLNYKKFHSVIVLAVVNANQEFMHVDIGNHGSASETAVFQNSKFHQKLSSRQLNIPPPSPLPDGERVAPYVFLGDTSSPLDNNFLKPYLVTDNTREEIIFNYRLSRARRAVENTFGVLSSRFRLFNQVIIVHVDKVDAITLACCYLHNFLLRKNKNYIAQCSLDREDIENVKVVDGDWRRDGKSLTPLKENTEQETKDGMEIRNIFKDYFNGNGKVAFQDAMSAVAFE